MRTKKGLTQDELGSPRYTGSYISAIEMGRSRPSSRVLRHIAGRLGIPMEALVSTESRAAELYAEISLAWGHNSRNEYRKALSILDGIAALGYGSIVYHHTRGIALFGLGRYDEAQTEYTSAERLARNSGDWTVTVRALADKAVCLMHLNRISMAAYVLEEADLLCQEQEVTDQQTLDFLYYHMGLVYSKLGQPERAQASYQRVLQSGRLSAWEQGTLFMGVANTLARQGRPLESIAYSQRAIERFEECNSQDLVGSTLLNMAESAIQAQDFAEARHLIEKAELTYEGIQHPRGLARARTVLGMLYLAQKDYHSSANSFRSVLDDPKVPKDSSLAGETWALLGDAEAELGHTEQAIDAYRQSAAIWREQGVLMSIYDVMTKLGQLFTRARRFEEAAATFAETARILFEHRYTVRAQGRTLQAASQ